MSAVLAFCLFKYFPHGGLQRDMVRIAQECQRRGASIRVYTLSWTGLVPEGFEICIVPVKAFQNHARARKFHAWVQAQLLERPVDHVVGFNKMPGLDVYYAADACYEEKSRTQRSMLYRLGSRYRLYAEFENAVFGSESRADILMISKAQAPLFIKHYGISTERMHFLPPNISKDRVAPQNAAAIRAAFRKENGFEDSEQLIVQIGSGFVTKGVDRSICAIAALPEAIRKKVCFWVVGADRKKRFERLARKLGVADRVVFTGGRSDIPQILLGADLMIHPAYNENTGTTLLEAVVAGLPVICSGACGYSGHIKNAECGYITHEPFDQEELNCKLEELLSSEMLPMLGKKAKKYAQSTDLYSMPERAADIILEAVKK